MAVDVNITSIGSGFNRSVIDDNFFAIQAALENALSRDGTLPNSMEADIDLDSNDLLNVGDINTQRLFVDGVEFVPANVTAVGDRGWSPSFAVVTDSARRVLQLTGYVGGEGTVPTDNVGKYVGATQMETLIANGVDIRGAQGATGAGTGDMLAAQNLNDVASKPTAFDNIKQAATETATGVVELATTVEAAAAVDTTRAVTPAGLGAYGATLPSPAEVVVASGTITSQPSIDLVLSSYTDYKHLRFVLTNVRPSVNGTDLRMRTSSDGGSSFDSSASHYMYALVVAYSTDNSAVDADALSSYILIENGLSSASDAGLDLDLVMYNWQSLTGPKRIAGQMIKSSSSGISLARNGGLRNSSSIVNAIRFYCGTGNINAQYTVYGIK